MTSIFLGAEFYSGNRTCSCGTPNSITGRYSIAVDFKAFYSKKDRQDWIDSGEKPREAITKSDMFYYSQGISIVDREQSYKNLIQELEILTGGDQ